VAYHRCVREARQRYPRKALGQHWLVGRRFLSRIAVAADFREEDTVIEVGAGTGLLTELLARDARCLIAVEVDPNLAAGLQERFASQATVSVVETDILALPSEELLIRGRGCPPYVVVGNLPYFIGTAIVRHFLRAAVPPRWLLVTLQAEVAQRMAAPPGRMSYLSVETQLFATARVLSFIPARAFRPPPKVRSAVLRLDLLDSPAVAVDDLQAFLGLVQAGFAAPRKRLRNSLAVGLRGRPLEAEAILSAAGVDAALRPAGLSLEDWARVYQAYRRSVAAGAK